MLPEYEAPRHALASQHLAIGAKGPEAAAKLDVLDEEEPTKHYEVRVRAVELAVG